MHWSAILINLVTFIYVAIAIDLFYKGNIGLGMCYAGYAFANVGIFITTLTTKG